MRYMITLLAGTLISLAAAGQIPDIDAKVDSLLNLMTLEEKIGQMAQAERTELEDVEDIATYHLGSLLSGGGSSPYPNTRAAWADMYDNFQSIALGSNRGIPLIYGADAVHGHNNVYGAVIFPHNIGLGCTWNAELVEAAQQVVALEVAATGVDWTFAPCIAVPRNERWGRTYEGFGETAEIQQIMAEASVKGLQGDDLGDSGTILACAKHYVGDGGTLNGTDQGNTVVTEEVLRELHMAGYIDAIEAGVGSIMASYNSWNGEKLHGHDYLLTDVLKNELGFEGFIVSDWAGVDQLDGEYREAIRKAINAGIDMVMVPDRYIVFIGHLKSLVEENEVSMDRIDDAVRRILKQKFLLNLFEEPYTDNSLAPSFGSQEHRDVARQAVRESLVLLNAKNDVLPLQKNGQTILVAGPLASDLGAQCGGWTISWQGSNGNITTGTNLLAGIQDLAGTSEVVYSASGDYDGPADVAVVVIGEGAPYAEGAGDRTSLDLETEDIERVKKIKEKGIPTVVLLVSGRPMIISEVLPFTDAMIAAWYPGTEGDGVAEVLFGDFAPSGQLTHSWPKVMDQVPINFGDNNYAPLFEYKHGLQYFPAASSSAGLLPYAATTNLDGTAALLTLSDQVTGLDYEDGDLEIRINGTAVPGMAGSITLAPYDESILVIELTGAVQQTDNITLSYSGSGIVSSGLMLESFEDFYVYNPEFGFAGVHEVPGKVQAEDYYDMYGIQTEPCSDVGGGINVGYIEAGDWLKYKVQVGQSGLYRMFNRIAGFEGGVLKITFNETIQTEVNYTPTGGWQNWQTFTNDVYLEEGYYEMKAMAQSSGFNINYYNFELIDGVNENQSAIQDITVYPNPVDGELKLYFNSTGSHNLTVKLIDITGRSVTDLYRGKTQPGAATHLFSIDPDLPSGLYFVELKDDTKRYFRKVVKE